MNLEQEIRDRGLAELTVPAAADPGAADWRREMKALFQQHVYGILPPLETVAFRETGEVREVFGGKARFSTVTLCLRTVHGEREAPLTLLQPLRVTDRVPVIVYLSFTPWPAADQAPLEEILDSGYGLMIVPYEAITSDDGDFTSGLAGIIDRDPGAADGWGKIALWAWAASRAVDYLISEDWVLPQRILVAGHSRLGKTALWAAVSDSRFSAVMVNESGCSGAAVTRGKDGERIADITRIFPYWFCPRYRDYAGRESDLPCEQHQLLAAVAPRRVYVASAAEDTWADPASEYLSVLLALRAWPLDPQAQFADAAFVRGEDSLPEPFSVVSSTVGYHCRPGSHWFSREDWLGFLHFETVGAAQLPQSPTAETAGEREPAPGAGDPAADDDSAVKPVLVIMAAGMGSRYGGLKQLEHVSEHEQAIIDYSIYDAWVAGFETVIFVIRPELEEAFRAAIGDRISRVMEVKYAFQELDDLPLGYRVPEGRTKPWGTGQAVLAARHLIRGPFCVINADDYYGSEAFKLIHAVLSRPVADDDRLSLSMVGYQLANTVTEHGFVSRGICELDDNNHLLSITERTRIVADADGRTSFSEDGGETWIPVSPQSVVSMNIWGFPLAFMTELERRFPAYLDGVQEDSPNGSEFFLPSVVGELISEGSARVRVLRSNNKWYGITYPEDLPQVRAAIAEMTAARLYPERLWI